MLSDISFFSSLSESELSNLELFCQLRRLNEWEILFNENDEATALYIVKSWKLKASRLRSDWENILWFIDEWWLVWEMAFYDIDLVSKRRTATVSAVEPTDVIVIMNYSIQELSNRHNDIYNKIVSIVESRKKDNLK